jgi:protein phosphatase 1G
MGIYQSKPVTTKITHSGETDDYLFAAASMQGWRNVLEDSWITIPDFMPNVSLFGVFDGHGGPEVAQFCAKYFSIELAKSRELEAKNYKSALENTFMQMDALLLSEEGQFLYKEFSKGKGTGLLTGCTAIIVLVTESEIFVANAGDSKAFLSKNQNEIISLSIDHLPNVKSERVRIKNAGGYVSEGRVNDSLNLTRSIGDLQFKQNSSLGLDQQIITSFPDVTQTSREDVRMIALGCDGIWEKYSETEVFEKLGSEKAQMSVEEMTSSITALFDSLLAKDTMEGVGCDNMTCVMIRFK